MKKGLKGMFRKITEHCSMLGTLFSEDKTMSKIKLPALAGAFILVNSNSRLSVIYIYTEAY